MRSILLLPLVAMCRDNICVYMAHVWECCVTDVVKDSGFSFGVVNYVVCLCGWCNGCCVFCLNCEAWSCM